MKYARFIPEKNRRETWEELVTRNKEMHQRKYPQLKDEIENVYKMVYDKKVLPSMRSLQFGGKPIEISPNRIYNCAYLPIDDWRAFGEVMFLLLGGTGVGYSVQKHHVETLPPIHRPKSKERRFLIGDSIEGWADAVKAVMKSYFTGVHLFVLIIRIFVTKVQDSSQVVVRHQVQSHYAFVLKRLGQSLTLKQMVNSYHLLKFTILFVILQMQFLPVVFAVLLLFLFSLLTMMI